LVPQALDQFAEASRLFDDKPGYFVRAADGAPVAAF
jgi:hypothetical protein